MRGSAAVCVSSLLNEMPGYSLKRLQLLGGKQEKAIERRSLRFAQSPHISGASSQMPRCPPPKYFNWNCTNQWLRLRPQQACEELPLHSWTHRNPEYMPYASLYGLVDGVVYYAAMKCASGRDDSVFSKVPRFAQLTWEAAQQGWHHCQQTSSPPECDWKRW